MKKLIAAAAAIVVFVIALILMRPEGTVPLPVAAVGLPQGHRLTETDIQMKQLPKSAMPEGAIADPKQLIGQTLRVERSQGDFFYPTSLGGETLELNANERAIAIHVTDAAGLGGLLKPGDRVGVTVTFAGQTFQDGESEDDDGRTGAYAKLLAGGLRVLYISPDFLALDPAPAAPSGDALAPAGQTRTRKADGVVVLAVPTDLQVILYDFLAIGAESQTRQVNLIDLLPALDQSNDVALSLVLEPKEAAAVNTSGVFLPDLVVQPGPVPTATPEPLVP